MLTDRANIDGYPAWDFTQKIGVSKQYDHYIIPVFGSTNSSVQAVLSFFHLIEEGTVIVDYLKRRDIDQLPYLIPRVTVGNVFDVTPRYSANAVASYHYALDALVFGTTDDALDPYLTIKDVGEKDCKITTLYLVTECWIIIAGQNYDLDCSTTTETETEVTTGCAGGSPTIGGYGGGGGTGGTGTGGTGVRINPNDRDQRCIEDEVDCEDSELSPEDTPGDKPLDVFEDKCAGLADLWNRSNGTGNPEVYGVLTEGGNFLVTQELDAAGGQVDGLYRQDDPTTGNEITYFFYPVSQGPVFLPGDNVRSNGTYYFIPITATVHSHSPCITDGTDGITNNNVRLGVLLL